MYVLTSPIHDLGALPEIESAIGGAQTGMRHCTDCGTFLASGTGRWCDGAWHCDDASACLEDDTVAYTQPVATQPLSDALPALASRARTWVERRGPATPTELLEMVSAAIRLSGAPPPPPQLATATQTAWAEVTRGGSRPSNSETVRTDVYERLTDVLEGYYERCEPATAIRKPMRQPTTQCTGGRKTLFWAFRR